MRSLDAVHYFVHIWFDPWEHPDFEIALTRRLEKIQELARQWLSQALVMVDTAMKPQENAVVDNLSAMKTSLSYFMRGTAILSRKQLKRSFTVQEWRDELQKELSLMDLKYFHAEIIDDLRLLFWETIPDFHSPDYWKNELLNEVFNVARSQRNYPNWYFEDKKDFDRVTQQRMRSLERYFFKQRRNLLDSEYSEHPATLIPSNIARRQRIQELTSWLENIPVINGLMQWTFLFVEAEEMRKSSHPTSRLLGTTKLRTMRRDFFSLQEGFTQQGLKITSTTTHIIWGEYLFRCVWTFSRMLKTFGEVDSYNNLPDPWICIIHSEDLIDPRFPIRKSLKLAKKALNSGYHQEMSKALQARQRFLEGKKK